MAIKLIGIGGEPAAGKTSLMIKLLRHYGATEKPVTVSMDLCRGLYFKKGKAFVLGIYDGQLFQGTDRLSMAVQPDALKFVRSIDGNSEAYDQHAIFFEGDRLFTGSFLKDARDLLGDERSRFYLLEALPEVKAQRHRQRSDQQTSTWLKSRASKYENLKMSCLWLQQRFNNTPEHQAQIFSEMLRFAAQANQAA